MPPDPTRRRLLGRVDPVVIACSLAMAGPVVGAGIRRAHAGWVPAADEAFIAGRAFDVFTSRTPLVGPHSLASASGQPAHSPGPLLYWLLAIPTRLGPTWTVPVFMGLINAALLCGVVALARRRAGPTFAIAMAAGCVLLVRAWGPAAGADTWNPSAGRIPLVLLALLAWSIADGETWLLPIAALVGSFTLQSHLSFAAPTIALFALALVGAAAASATGRWAHTPEDPNHSPRYRSSTDRRPAWEPWLFTVLVLAACWALPVAQQLRNDTGNLGLISQSAQADRPHGGPNFAWSATSNAVGIPPEFVRSESSLTTSIGDHLGPPSATDRVTSVVAAAALLAAAVLALVRRDRALGTGALVALALVTSVAASAWKFPTDDFVVAFYAFKWFALAGLATWLVAALAITRACGLWRGPAEAGTHSGDSGDDHVGGTGGARSWRALADRARRSSVAAFGVGIILALVLGLALPGHDASAAAYPSAKQLGDVVVAQTNPGGRYLVGRSGTYDIAYTSVISYRLRRAGRDPIATGPVADALGDDAYRPTGVRCDAIVVLQPAIQRVPAFARTLAIIQVPPSAGATPLMRVLLTPDRRSHPSC